MPAARKGAGKKSAPKRPKRATPREKTANTMAVRILYGEHAGQIVQVTREQAVELCGGWTPRAEPVAVKPADQRETR